MMMSIPTSYHEKSDLLNIFLISRVSRHVFSFENDASIDYDIDLTHPNIIPL